VREKMKRRAGRETNDPVSRCAEVIKSRQIFSLSRYVSDTYIILKELFRRHYAREKRAPIPSLREPLRCVSACGGLSQAISLLRLQHASSSARCTHPLLSLYHSFPFLFVGYLFSRISIGRARIIFTSVNATSARSDRTRISSLRMRRVRRPV